jgi:adenylate cyclase
MTQQILDLGGVVSDFQGDAAMGFWGWPLEQPDAVQRACKAALAIRAHFEANARHAENPLSGFRVGIGIATGPAVAGKIGTIDQAKVGVFGPTVNLASRLENLTKIVHAPIVLDDATAQLARQQFEPTAARVRRLAVVRPYGLETALAISELLPPLSDFPQMKDEDIRHYEEALDAFAGSRWPEAYERLHRVTPDDLAKDFLTIFIAQHNRVPPTGWDGVIPLASKS